MCALIVGIPRAGRCGRCPAILAICLMLVSTFIALKLIYKCSTWLDDCETRGGGRLHYQLDGGLQACVQGRSLAHAHHTVRYDRAVDCCIELKLGL